MTETIVMIHGMWGTPRIWENYRGFFEQRGYRCVIPALRFHDADPASSPDPELGRTGLLDYASDLEREIMSLDSKPIIMGHSMGGLLAQILGSRGLAKALVLLTPAAPEGIFSIRLSVLRTFFRVMSKWGFWNKPMKLSFGAARYSLLALMGPEQRREIYADMVYESGRAAAEIGFWFFDKHHAARVDASKITCPVLVVAGSRDRITPATVSRKIAQRYPGYSTYKEYPDHAHWVIGEPGWNLIAEDIERWLQTATP
ncbi:MAG: alpha/beta hydrolase [Pseudomonadota bacterium]